jgi:RES domain-containing protein
LRLVTRVFRAHHPRWAFAPHSGEGAARHGGRFNPQGMPALYTSRRVETAWLEAQQGFPFKPQPMTICAYEVDCEDILDLTNPAELARLAIASADLSAPWEDLASRGEPPPTWTMAQRLSAEVAGIIVPSFAPGASGADVNVVFWRWSDRVPHLVRVIDDWERLPKNESSWL